MQSPNRTIIIPRGILNSDTLNVVVIPAGLQNTTQPLVVRPAGGKLMAQSLPIWGDDLDTSGVPQDLGRTMEYAADTEPESWQDEYSPESVNTSLCTSWPDSSPKILRMTSRTVNITNDDPQGTVNITFDAPEGVSPGVFQAVMREGVSDRGRPDLGISYGAMGFPLATSSRVTSPAQRRARQVPVAPRQLMECQPCPGGSSQQQAMGCQPCPGGRSQRQTY